MDSFVLRWRALWWGRVWGAVLVLTLAWSIGVGLALRAVVPGRVAPGHEYDCIPTAVQPLIVTPVDWLWLPVHAAIAAPYGLYESGLQIGVIVLAVVLIPAALLQQGTARRVLGAPVLIAVAALMIWMGWNYELAVVRAAGVLPTLVCTN